MNTDSVDPPSIMKEELRNDDEVIELQQIPEGELNHLQVQSEAVDSVDVHNSKGVIKDVTLDTSKYSGDLQKIPISQGCQVHQMDDKETCDIRSSTNYEVIEDTGDTAEDDEESLLEEDDCDHKLPEEMLAEGKRLFAQQLYDEAAEILSRAVEKKLKVESLDEWHPDMCEYYLWYGDALLTKEENQNELFDMIVSKKINGIMTTRSVTSTTTESVGNTIDDTKKLDTDESVSNEGKNIDNEQDDVSDEQLAFEILEMCRKSFLKRIEVRSLEMDKVGHEDPIILSSFFFSKQELLDWSYAHIRLGDIEFLNEFFKEAADDYREAYNIRLHNKDKVGNYALLAPLLSMAQSVLFSGDKITAMNHFKDVLKLVQEELSNCDIQDDRNSDSRIIQKLRDTEEDIIIQIADIEKKIVEENRTGIVKNEKGSQSEAKSCIPVTTSTFDQPTNLDAKIRKVNISPKMTKKGNQENDNLNIDSDGFVVCAKKRKIDISEIAFETSDSI